MFSNTKEYQNKIEFVCLEDLVSEDRHVWEEHKEKVRLNRLSKSGKSLYKYRKEKIERSFADSKKLHGLHSSRLLGLKGATKQTLLTAVVQNIRRLSCISHVQHRCIFYA